MRRNGVNTKLLQFNFSPGIHLKTGKQLAINARRALVRPKSLNCKYDADDQFSDTNCNECGSHFSPCIASGQSILAKVFYTCKTCKHKALDAELQQLRLKHCTLCHGKIDTGMLVELPIGAPQAEPRVARDKKKVKVEVKQDDLEAELDGI